MATGQTHSAVLKTSVLAAAVGAGVALLIAPHSGRQTRRGVRNRLSLAQNRTGRMMRSFKNALKQEKEVSDVDLSKIEMRVSPETHQPSPILTNWEKEL